MIYLAYFLVGVICGLAAMKVMDLFEIPFKWKPLNISVYFALSISFLVLIEISYGA